MATEDFKRKLTHYNRPPKGNNLGDREIPGPGGGLARR
jgi:hypothetical protein